MRLVAERAGFVVDTASNGIEALEKLHQNDYAVAVLDLMMPRVSGYEVLDRLGDLKKCPAIVVVTAMNDAHLSGLDAGRVNSILRKPFDIDMLAAVLTELAASFGKSIGASSSEPEADSVLEPPARPESETGTT